jgi:hypothetical protein
MTTLSEIVCIENKTSANVAMQFENSWLARYPLDLFGACTILALSSLELTSRAHSLRFHWARSLHTKEPAVERNL